MPAPEPNKAGQPELLVRRLGRQGYRPVWQAMQAFNQARTVHTPDEIWLLEHPAVYTLGLNGKQSHILDAGEIPLIQTDRGGQVTYHGPGQLVVYLLMDLKRHGLGVRSLVSLIEQSIIALLADYGIDSVARQDAPGVYVNGAKIAALGLRIKQGCSYHGLSLNIDMDLEPFSRINPCGYEGLAITQLRTLRVTNDMEQIADALLGHIASRLDSPWCRATAKEGLFKHD